MQYISCKLRTANFARSRDIFARDMHAVFSNDEAMAEWRAAHGLPNWQMDEPEADLVVETWEDCMVEYAYMVALLTILHCCVVMGTPWPSSMPTVVCDMLRHVCVLSRGALHFTLSPFVKNYACGTSYTCALFWSSTATGSSASRLSW